MVDQNNYLSKIKKNIGNLTNEEKAKQIKFVNKKRDKSKKEDLSRSVLEAGLEPARTLLFIGF